MKAIQNRNTTVDTIACLMDEMVMYTEDDAQEQLFDAFQSIEIGRYKEAVDILQEIDLGHYRPRFEGYITMIKHLLGEA